MRDADADGPTGELYALEKGAETIMGHRLWFRRRVTAAHLARATGAGSMGG
jgi:hypothetical protein